MPAGLSMERLAVGVSGASGAAARLGIPASTLESKIKALRIEKHRFKHPRSPRRGRYWLMCQPPFGDSTCPVTYLASSLAR
jgi:hypothetical protein